LSHNFSPSKYRVHGVTASIVYRRRPFVAGVAKLPAKKPQPPMRPAARGIAFAGALASHAANLPQNECNNKECAEL
jgi:hypothetical protein